MIVSHVRPISAASNVHLIQPVGDGSLYFDSENILFFVCTCSCGAQLESLD